MAKAISSGNRAKAMKQLNPLLGRVFRDIKRKIIAPDLELQNLLELGERLFNQKKSDKKKLLSIHEVQEECIGKGTAHKKFASGANGELVNSAQATGSWKRKHIQEIPTIGHLLKSA